MLNKLMVSAINRSGVTVIFSLLLIIAGWFAFQNLPIDAVPDITNIQVQVNSSVEGLVPEEIERFITFPIESAMAGLPNVEEVRSITRFGLSQVTIIFKEASDIFQARQLVSERLQSVRAELPAGVNSELGPVTTGLGEIFFYSLEAKEPATGEERLEQLMELKAIQDWIIKPRMLKVAGVAEVNSIGGFDKQYYVQPDINKLVKYGIHIRDIVEAIEANNRNTGAGYIKQTAEQILVQVEGFIKSKEDIEAIPIKRLPLLQTVTLGDIATVQLARQLRTGAATLNGQETILGTVLMLLGENSRTTAERVAEALKEIQQTLPDWVQVKAVYNRSDLVNATLDTVKTNLLLGAGLVVLVLLLLVGNVRVALITAVTIPLAMCGTFILMRYFHVSGNLMSLGALDFGIIIDGAVIVIDNCVRVLKQRNLDLGRRLTRVEIKQAVTDATLEIRKAAGLGQLIIAVAFLPIFALESIEGKMFIPMALTFCFALLTGFILSFTTIPALAALLLPGDLAMRQPLMMRLFERLYQPLLQFSLRWKFFIIGIVSFCIALGIYLFTNMGSDFMPQLDEGSIAIQIVRPADISIDQAVELQRLTEEILLEFPEVASVFSRLGTGEIATDPMGVHVSDTYVLLKPDQQWPKNQDNPVNKAELIRAIKDKLEFELAGQRLIFSQPIQLRFNELLEGVRAELALKLFGSDTAVLDQLAQEAAAIIRSIEGAGDVEEEIDGTSPVLRIRPDISVLRNWGIAKETVLTAVETAIGGSQAGFLYEGVRRFPIIVRLSETERNDLQLIRQLPVGVAENLNIPLHELASIQFEESYGEIRREASHKRSAVLITVRGRDTESFAKQAEAAIAESLQLPPGYYMEWGGNYKNLISARQRLILLVPIALLLIFLMVYMAVGSILQTLLIFLSLPMALLGGVLGLKWNGLEFSISAGIGFIALSGIAVLNGVVIISYFNQLRKRGLAGQQLVTKGAMIRLRPVLMTALTDVFGFLPMMFSQGMGAEVQQPLASVVVGGVLSSSFLTLILLPIMYLLLEKFWSSESSAS